MGCNEFHIGYSMTGITEKLEHFQDAGIGAIWLSPIYASPMVDFGYDISDFRKIDENYGTMEDLEALTAKAKKLGIKVIHDSLYILKSGLFFMQCCGNFILILFLDLGNYGFSAESHLR